MEQQNIKTPIVFRIGVILLCLVLLSIHMVGNGLYARYSSNAIGSGGASVASFNISAVAESNTEELDLDLSIASDITSKFYGFTVHNNSDVKVVCMVTVTLDQKLPVGVEATMNLGKNTIDLIKVSDTKYTCSATLDFQEKHEYTLIFTGDPATVTENTALNVNIDVAVEQID